MLFRSISALAIIGVPAVVVLMIPDVGSLLVFFAFAIALYREGLSGWLFIFIFVFAAVFLVALAINPLYVIGGIIARFSPLRCADAPARMPNRSWSIHCPHPEPWPGTRAAAHSNGPDRLRREWCR